ncbi:hypothetical protein SKC41_08390 [Mycobacterium sp. 050128]|uniref:PPE domain-containing protein n=1 Tax=Mycobacterium sp. 050128 TaxID=3096112 RepID=UPI002EDAFB0C
MAQTLNVELDELLARAGELEAAIPGLPTENPQAPCALPMVVTAAKQLAASADNLRIYLAVGDRERRRLAEALRNAAKAYEETDESAERAINDNTSVSAAAVSGRGFETQGVLPIPELVLDPTEGAPYRELKQATKEIAEPDQGVAFDSFADAWSAYGQSLLDASYAFRPFRSWRGDALYSVESSFDQQKEWTVKMAEACATMATQARKVAAAQRWAWGYHPPLAEVEEYDRAWVEAMNGLATATDKKARKQYTELQQKVTDYYKLAQQVSEQVLAQYKTKAELPLTPVDAMRPPQAYYIAAPPDLGNGNENDNGIGDGIGDLPSGPQDLPIGDNVSGLTGMPPVGMPPIPGTPNDPKLAGALGAKPPSSKVKPASVKPPFGGAKAGAGISLSTPLGSAAGAGAGGGVPAPPRPDHSRWAPGAAGATGGGGVGMAPVGGSPSKQAEGGGKGGKRAGGEQAIYTEMRAWTEAVIGLLQN